MKIHTHPPSHKFLFYLKEIVSHIKPILFCLTEKRSHWLHLLNSLKCQVLLSHMREGLLFCFYHNPFPFVDIISPVINQRVQGEHHIVPLHPLCQSCTMLSSVMSPGNQPSLVLGPKTTDVNHTPSCLKSRSRCCLGNERRRTSLAHTKSGFLRIC